jgi:hypothetical protein
MFYSRRRAEHGDGYKTSILPRKISCPSATLTSIPASARIRKGGIKTGQPQQNGANI